MDTEVPRSCGGRLSLEFCYSLHQKKPNPEGEILSMSGGLEFGWFHSCFLFFSPDE